MVAPSPELRNVFIKLIVCFCHFAINDEPLLDVQLVGDNLCEQILLGILYLLKSDVPDNGKHLAQYFTLFNMYAGLGVQQKQQLLKVHLNDFLFLPNTNYINKFFMNSYFHF